MPATGTAIATALGTVLGTVRLRPVPMSVPEAVRWPVVRIRSSIPDDQPPLPWSAGADDTTPLTGRQGLAGTVRMVRFGDSWAGPPADDLPDPGTWSVSLAVALSETLRGTRPVTQLNRWLDPPTLAYLAVRVFDRNRGRTPPRTSPTLQAVHLHRSAPDVVEVVALFSETAAPTSALAFRLEAMSDRWLCTALETRPRREVSPRA